MHPFRALFCRIAIYINNNSLDPNILLSISTKFLIKIDMALRIAPGILWCTDAAASSPSPPSSSFLHYIMEYFGLFLLFQFFILIKIEMTFWCCLTNETILSLVSLVYIFNMIRAENKNYCLNGTWHRQANNNNISRIQIATTRWIWPFPNIASANWISQQ